MKSFHNIETRVFPGMSCYCGYSDGVWYIRRKTASRCSNWICTSREGGYNFEARTMDEVSKELERMKVEGRKKWYVIVVLASSNRTIWTDQIQSFPERWGSSGRRHAQCADGSSRVPISVQTQVTPKRRPTMKPTWLDIMILCFAVTLIVILIWLVNVFQ